MSIKIELDCPECGQTLEIKDPRILSWGEGFQLDIDCTNETCKEKMKISYMQEAPDE